MSTRAVSRELNVHCSTISHLHHRFREFGSTSNLPHYRTVTMPAQDLHIHLFHLQLHGHDFEMRCLMSKRSTYTVWPKVSTIIKCYNARLRHQLCRWWPLSSSTAQWLMLADSGSRCYKNSRIPINLPCSLEAQKDDNTWWPAVADYYSHLLYGKQMVVYFSVSSGMFQHATSLLTSVACGRLALPFVLHRKLKVPIHPEGVCGKCGHQIKPPPRPRVPYQTQCTSKAGMTWNI